ncbi:methyltransferase [Paramagnetospirillum kuznetsovii]|uniref:Methyltransferase n=1 Tax=Paramagnetospirillum kuznetsovii TaxID=2053833 RepID=A0A364NZF9_9PROT|nr:methyltransferase [Paramagnetospirillum kuznetsovii]RAU22456.1 methyltransferase [Paramagnetospirillum kuznetsovii]
MPTEFPFTLTDDRLLDGRVRLFQPQDGYRAAVDPVLLAAAVHAGPGESVLDLGCGAGAAALCLMARIGGVRVTGLEIQPDMVRLARMNAQANAAADFTVVEGSIAAPPPGLGPFDHVMTNPPYGAAGRGTPPPVAGKAVAHVEGESDLRAWIKAAAKLLKPKGSLTLIHRADRLDEILAALSGRGLGAIHILPLWPKAGRSAGRVVVSARKGSKAPLEVLPGLVLHGDNGAYSRAAEAILRGAGALSCSGSQGGA